MKPNILKGGFLIALGLLSMTCVATEPKVVWTSEPVLPDETVCAIGGEFSESSSVMVGILSNDAAELAPTKWETASVLQRTNASLKFVLPKTWSPGIYAFKVKNPDGESVSYPLNNPLVKWTQGDNGDTATPGGLDQGDRSVLEFRGLRRTQRHASVKIPPGVRCRRQTSGTVRM